MVDVFVDTSAWYALRVANDRQHAAARRILDRLARQQASLHTSDWCLVETLALVARRVGKVESIAAGDWILSSGAVHVHAVAESLTPAWESYRSKDGNVSLVDCGSFAVMERLAIKRAFAFDEDFTGAGMTVEKPD